MIEFDAEDQQWSDLFGAATKVRNPFKLKQYIGGPSEHLAQQLFCKSCGGMEFHVAKADYFTGIRCVRCLKECCVHEG